MHSQLLCAAVAAWLFCATDLGAASRRWTVDRDGGVPLTFVPNRGQMRSEVLFHGRRDGLRFAFLRGEVLVAMSGDSKAADDVVLALQFVDARPHALPEARKPSAADAYHRISSAIRWDRALPAYEEIVYRELWPSIDLVFRGGEDDLDYRFVVHPGGDISKIRLAWNGAERISIAPGGTLRIETPHGAMLDAPPIGHQRSPEGGIPIASRYILHDSGMYGIGIDPYDACRPLIIVTR